MRAVRISSRALPAGAIALLAAVALMAGAIALLAAVAAAPAPARPASFANRDAQRTAQAAGSRFICSGANAAHVPCRFATPSGNVRCEWTPARDTVVCELLATGRAYRLRPTGHAQRVRVHLRHPGRRLPTDQQLVFPNQLSCHDTRTTMTCNQDFLTGEFTLAPHHSRSS